MFKTNKARLWLRLSLLVILVGVLISLAIWFSGDSLDPEETVALKYTYYNYVHPDANAVKKYMSKNDTQVINDLGQIVHPGSVHVGKKENDFTDTVVIFFDDPKMTIQGNRLEVELVKEDGQWKVIHDRFRGTNLTFEQFQQDPSYQKVGITEWKETELTP